MSIQRQGTETNFREAVRLVNCKYFLKDPKSPTGGICGYCNCCPHVDDPSVYCPNKEIVHEYEKKRNQQDPPTQEEIQAAERGR